VARLTTIVYVGPTLDVREVTARLPGADVRPPAAAGDVLAAARRGRRIALIDGYFEHVAAVWHKEILVALERGAEVWGAASMGALRAAELAPFGMRGVGVVFRAFARGTLDADDEVAVAHLPAEHGYRPVSDALVNLRDGIARVPGLSAATRAALVALARARFYRERSWQQLDADARRVGLPRRELDALLRWPKPDRKAADARLLLRRLCAAPPARAAARVRVPRTWALRQLLDGAW
jgi:hypothetical protein